MNPSSANAVITVTRDDLPLHCPMPDAPLWNSHPRVYIPLEEAESGECSCPYCGTIYRLEETFQRPTD